MGKKKESSPLEYSELGTHELGWIVQQLTGFAKRYEDVQKALEELGPDARMRVKGIASLNGAIKRISGHLSSVDIALLAEQFKAQMQGKKK